MNNNCHLFFSAIATKLRIDIISKLYEKESNVTELAKELKEERSKISHALISLSNCNFVTAKKHGRNRIYRLNDDTIMPLFNLVDKHVKKYCKYCRKQNRGN